MADLAICELLGKTLSKIDGTRYDDELVFTTDLGELYALRHLQDCCESVRIEEIVGDLQDLVDSPIIQAECNTSSDDPIGYVSDGYRDSYTWMFYRLATAKGQVVIRWLGESNGYYSEGVDFVKLI